ncbi:MAG: substrate-binding domain-containing protein [Geminicoccaceae bacterium]
MRFLVSLCLCVLVFAASAPPVASDRFITLASTTSTENSGLLAHLLPMFTAGSGVQVRVVALGTGKAIRTARDGDADLLLVHDRASEEAFVSQGYGLERVEIMYNDFVRVGPKADPAGAARQDDLAEALRAIAEQEETFLSRGDDSGTHKAERRLWRAASIEVGEAVQPWYREAGAGMGAVLNMASGIDAYTLTARGTWLSFRNKRDLTLLFEGDPALFNQYAAILVDPGRHPHAKTADAQALVDWLVSPEGQAAIDTFKVGSEQLFFANAGDGES